MEYHNLGGWCIYIVCPLEVSDALCSYRLVAACCLNEPVCKYSTLDLFPWKLPGNWICFCSRAHWNHLDCWFCYLMPFQFIFNPWNSGALEQFLPEERFLEQTVTVGFVLFLRDLYRSIAWPDGSSDSQTLRLVLPCSTETCCGCKWLCELGGEVWRLILCPQLELGSKFHCWARWGSFSCWVEKNTMLADF